MAGSTYVLYRLRRPGTGWCVCVTQTLDNSLCNTTHRPFSSPHTHSVWRGVGGGGGENRVAAAHAQRAQPQPVYAAAQLLLCSALGRRSVILILINKLIKIKIYLF